MLTQPGQYISAAPQYMTPQYIACSPQNFIEGGLIPVDHSKEKFLVQMYNPAYAQGIYTSFETQEAAQEAAETEAHRTQSAVVIFKAVTKVAPKREVTVTDISGE